MLQEDGSGVGGKADDRVQQQLIAFKSLERRSKALGGELPDDRRGVALAGLRRRGRALTLGLRG
jgi:hypothetical protein